jgi:hypothetical protein
MNYKECVTVFERMVPRRLFLLAYGVVAFFKTSFILYFRLGHVKSAFLWRSIDRCGDPIPWFSYPALAYLDGLNICEMSVFEYGSGNSTLYWSRRAKSICSVEDNVEWAERIRSVLGPMSSCVRMADSNRAYAEMINEADRDYDIIVIDGSVRFDCAKAAIPRLRKGGLVILDDSDCHADAVALLREADLIQVNFVGFAPINSYLKTTSFFFHRSFSPCLVS